MQDYTGVKSLVENENARSVQLRASSVSLIIQGLLSISDRWVWGEVTDEQWDEISAWIDGGLRDVMVNERVGEIIMLARENMPLNVLALDGDTYSKDDFPDLYAVLPASWKTATDFTLPDYGGMFPLVANGSYPQGSIGGEVTHTLTLPEIPSHNHAYRPLVSGDLDVEGVGVPQPNAAQLVPLLDAYTDNAGGGNEHNNMPPYAAIVFGVIAW